MVNDQRQPHSSYAISTLGYSLVIGFTVITIPLSLGVRQSRFLILPYFSSCPRIIVPPLRRVISLIIGFAYPAAILVAIIATENHFILDTVVGAVVCGLSWWGNSILLNLLPLQDYFLWAFVIHKPECGDVEIADFTEVESIVNLGDPWGGKTLHPC